MGRCGMSMPRLLVLLSLLTTTYCLYAADDKLMQGPGLGQPATPEQIAAYNSSIFPDAPGMNPSLTIMALSLKASRNILKEVGHG